MMAQKCALRTRPTAVNCSGVVNATFLQPFGKRHIQNTRNQHYKAVCRLAAAFAGPVKSMQRWRDDGAINTLHKPVIATYDTILCASNMFLYKTYHTIPIRRPEGVLRLEHNRHLVDSGDVASL